MTSITNISYIDDIIYKHLHKSFLNDVHHQMISIRNYETNYYSISDESNEQYEKFQKICFKFYESKNYKISYNDIENLLNQYKIELDDDYYDEIEIIDVYNLFNMNFNQFGKYFSTKYETDMYDVFNDEWIDE